MIRERHLLERVAGLVLGLSLVGCAPGSDPTQEVGAPPSGTRDAVLRRAFEERTRALDPREHGIGRSVPDLGFRDVEDRAGRLSEVAGPEGLVLFVRETGCPVSKRLGPEIARIEEDYASRGLGFLFVNFAPHDSAEDVRAEIAAFGFDGRYALDPEGLLARELGALTTTDVFVLDAARTLVYRGAVDDQYGRGTALEEPRHRYLRDALDAVLAGERVKVSATTAPGCFLALDAAELVDEAAREVTYHDQVERIVQRNCVECHRDGGAAPFALDSYEEVRGRKGMIGFVVANQVMPPWFAAEGTGPWENERRLSREDRETLARWIEDGCPEGDPADAPVPRRFPDGWLIGSPDVVFEFPAFDIPAEGVVDLTKLFAEEVVPRDLWVRALEVLPSEPQVVHHATALFLPPPDAKEPTRALLERLVPWRERRGGWQFLFGYLPGKGPRTYDEGVARFLPAGSRIRIEMHYTPDGIAVTDRTRLGLVEAAGPPELVAQSRLLRNKDLVIPPGASEVAFAIDYALPEAVLLRSLTPHMHLLGRRFEVSLEHPSGERRHLLTIPEWDPDWQFSYVFREPPLAEAGTVIHVRATFDNSLENPNNAYPGREVRDGPQIWDEMLILAAEWIVPRTSP